MARAEFVSPEGLRTDGRRPHELRAISGSLGVNSQADGSSMLSIGNTRVLASVIGPHEVLESIKQLSLPTHTITPFLVFSVGRQVARPCRNEHFDPRSCFQF